MPFSIIRADITTLHVDAIVNAANETLLGGGGVDGAIHRAAGPGLLEECRMLGGCRVGEAKITYGYCLPAKYVIHTVGPVWRGGNFGEMQLLRNAYLHSLELAVRYGCESVAFPLISSGAYGAPKLSALQIATDAIRDFLVYHDLQVYLAVYDQEAFRLSVRSYREIEAFIDQNYVDAHTCEDDRTRSLPACNAPPPDMRVSSIAPVKPSPYAAQNALPVPAASAPPKRMRRPLHRKKDKTKDKETSQDANLIEMPQKPPEAIEPEASMDLDNCVTYTPTPVESLRNLSPHTASPGAVRSPAPSAEMSKQVCAAPTAAAPPSLENMLSQLDESFSRTLLRMIDERGMKDSECYKKANVDRKLFSKIRSDPHYHPRKSTALAFAIALELSLTETSDLLRRAGFALTHASKFDVIVEYFIRCGNYNIFEINEALFAFDQALLGG